MTGARLQIFKLLDFGDRIGVEGRVCSARKTNELTIWASRLHFSGEVSAAAAREVAWPDGRRDRYRQRYLDLIVQPRRAAGVRGARAESWPSIRRVHDQARATSKSRRR